MAERNSSLIPITPLKKGDWSEKTTTSWQEHSGFLERTNGKGFAAPLRLDHYAGPSAARVKASGNTPRGGGSGSTVKVLALLVLLPVLGAGVYFGALGGDPKPVLAMVGMGEATQDEVAEAPPKISKIAKNPKKANVNAEAQGLVTGQPAEPVRDPAAAPGTVAPAAAPIAPPAAAPVAPAAPAVPSAPAAPAAAPAPAATLPTQLPPKPQAAVLPINETPAAKMKRLESRLHPLIKLSTQPNSALQKTAVSRDSALIALDHEEIKRLRDSLARDHSLNLMVKSWRTQALQNRAISLKAVPTFKELSMSDLSAVEAKIELQKIRELTMAAVALGEPDLAKKLVAQISNWTRVYRPLGDAMSDAEVEPVIEAFALLQATLPMDQRNGFDSWLFEIADRQVTELFEHPTTNDLYFAKHLKTMAMIGFATGNTNIQSYVLANFDSHVASSIMADGSTTTYQTTHSIVKHAEHLQSLLRVSVLLNRANETSTQAVPTLGSPLAKAIDFAYPYLLGKMEHIEFRGAKASTEMPKVLNPAQAMGLLDNAIYFRKSLVPEVAAFTGLAGAPAWDPTSLYFASMTRKTDNFESQLLSRSGLRAPSAAEIKNGNGAVMNAKSRPSKVVRK